ncbi:MAG: DUF2470 domain-containing protein [Frankia sp.]
MDEPITMPEAEHARTVVAGARHALLTLSVDRMRGWVGFLDDGGEAIILAGAASPPAAAGLTGSHARVDVPGPAGERVILIGDLRPLPGSAEKVSARLSTPERPVTLGGADVGLAAVALSVLDVVFCRPALAERAAEDRHLAGSTRSSLPAPALASAPTRTSARAAGREWATEATGQRIPLAAYALAEPDLVLAYARDLTSHLNHAHAQQVRQLATAAEQFGNVAGPGVGELIGAQLTGLDHTGLDLWRVGAGGAEAARLTFRRPLRAPSDLGAELRWLLERVR